MFVLLYVSVLRASYIARRDQDLLRSHKTLENDKSW